ncbi:MAG TPA: hypothetical protein VMV74_09735 [Bacteroidales bacterium]|nr:hypothetical protein [Bacteroidales bacterium]
MNFTKRYDNIITGVVSGLIIPLIGFALFYLVTAKGLSPGQYLKRVEDAGNIARIMSVAVFSNIIIFLVFNRLDMLKALKGVLGITFVWAFVVFGIKLL